MVNAKSRRNPSALLLLLLGALALFALLLTMQPPPAQAQAVTDLVSNTAGSSSGSSNSFAAQSFTTGANAGGYTLSEVRIKISTTGSTSMKIREDSSGAPGSELATLTNPSSIVANSLNTFTAPSGTTLAANTTYWVSVSEGVSSGKARLTLTDSDSETGSTGWTIGNGSLFRNSEANSWSSSTDTLTLAIRGSATDTTKPTVTDLSVNGNKLTVTFDEAMDPCCGGDWRVGVGGTLVGNTPGTPSAEVLTLTLASPVVHGQVVQIIYDGALESVKDVSNNRMLVWNNFRIVTNSTPPTVPLVVRTPARPTGLTATGGPGQVTLTWDAGTDDGGAAIDRWEYRQRAGSGSYGGWTLLSTDPATVSHVLVSLVPYTRYTYQVRAHNPKGYGSSATASATTTAWPPAQPTGLTATAGNSQVELAWTSGGDGGLAITSWQVHQGTTSSATPPTTGWKRISGSGAATMSHTIYRLTNGTQLFFRVRAVNGVGNGAASAEISATPAATVPTAPTLTASPGNTQVKLAWTSGGLAWTWGGDGGSAITSWQVHQGTTSSATPPTTGWTAISGSGAGTTSHTTTSLTNGTALFFRVRAVNGEGNGAASAEISATPAAVATVPSAPALTATSTVGLGPRPEGFGHVDLRPTPTSDGGAAITRWDWRVASDGTLDTETWRSFSLRPTDATRANTDAIIINLGPLVAGKEYFFQMRAHNAVGDGAPSAVVSATPYGLPSAPTLRATPGEGQVTLRWRPGYDGKAAIDRYEYRYSTDATLDGLSYVRLPNGQRKLLGPDDAGNPEAWTVIPDSAKGGANAASFTVTGLTRRGTVHLFQIRAHNLMGDGLESTEVRVTPYGVPWAPTLTATPGDGQVTLRYAVPWINSITDGDGGRTIDRFEYRQSTDGALDTETWRAIPSSRAGRANAASFTVTGLTNGTEHRFQVRAHNSVGNGDPSAEVSATPGVPLAPTSLTAEAGNTQVKLTWVSGGDGGTAIDRWDWRWTADGRLDTETWNRVPSSGPTTTTHTVTGLTNGTAALFQVRAVNSNGVGAPSPVVSATPLVSGAGGNSTPEPSTRPGRAVNLAASEADGAVTLTWDAPADGGAPSGYMILRRAPGLGQRDLRTLTEDTGSAATTHTDTGVQPGVKYIYSVKARNSAGQGAPSRPAQITTAAAAANNPPAFGSETYTFTVSESATAGDVVGSVAATDSDAGDELSYTITAGNEAGKFAIGSADGQVTVAGALDYETAASHTLTVQAGDGNGGADTATVTITVTDANEAPVFNPGSYAFSIAESANTWTSVGQLTATDQDAGDTVTYSITSGNADDRFMIDWNYGDILLMKELDYETTSSYTLTVEARDGNGGTATAVVVITVTQANGSPTANESPTFDTASYDFTTPEDAATGGSVGAVSASDPDEGQSVAYSITAGNDAGKFSINAGTGEVAVASALDHETASSYTLTVQARDGNGGRDTATVVITVTKVNSPPEFGSGTYAFTVSESAAAGGVVGSVAATDSDAGDELSYTITAGNEAGKFAMGSADGRVTVAGALDHATAASHTLTVEAGDGNGGADTATVVVTVTKVNSPPEFGSGTYAFTVSESATAGDVVGSVAATDSDAGDELSYTITAGNAAGKFSINAGTGEVAVASALDHETASSYTLTVRAGDGNGGTATATVVVTVTKVNSPPEFGSGTYAFPVSESAPAGDVVGSVAATDSDAGDELSYTITAGNAAGKFAVGPADGQVTVAGTLDYATAASYTLTVQAGDGNGGTDTASVVVTVTKANESPTFDTASYDFTIPEDTATGGSVGTSSASDPDEGQSVAYSITAGNDAGKFSINAGTGEVSVASALDHETASSYTLTVQASDGNGGTDTATVTITVTDVNEAPVFNPGSYAFSIAESANTWTSIGRLTATDQDAGDTITYYITSGNADDRFAIDWNHGDILLMKELDYETAPSYTLTVEARDGNGGTATATVEINVTDVAE